MLKLPVYCRTHTHTRRRRRYLIEESFWKLLETLGTHEALLVVQFPVAVDDLLQRGEAALAALTHGVGQSVGHVAEGEKRLEVRMLQFRKLKVKKRELCSRLKGTITRLVCLDPS